MLIRRADDGQRLLWRLSPKASLTAGGARDEHQCACVCPGDGVCLRIMRDRIGGPSAQPPSGPPIALI